MSGWKDEVSFDDRHAMAKQCGAVRLTVHTTRHGAWAWELQVDIDPHGWKRVVGGVAKTLVVAQAAAQLAASGLKDNAEGLGD